MLIVLNTVVNDIIQTNLNKPARMRNAYSTIHVSINRIFVLSAHFETDGGVIFRL